MGRWGIIEKSKSNRVSCHVCGNQIKKGENRYKRNEFPWPDVKYYYWCKKCGREVIKRMFDVTKKKYDELKEMLNKFGGE